MRCIKQMVKLPHYYLSRIVSIGNDRAKNEDVLRTVKEERIAFYIMKWKKADWIGHILSEKCLLQHVIKGKIKGTERRGNGRN